MCEPDFRRSVRLDYRDPKDGYEASIYSYPNAELFEQDDEAVRMALWSFKHTHQGCEIQRILIVRMGDTMGEDEVLKEVEIPSNEEIEECLAQAAEKIKERCE